MKELKDLLKVDNCIKHPFFYMYYGVWTSFKEKIENLGFKAIQLEEDDYDQTNFIIINPETFQAVWIEHI